MTVGRDRSPSIAVYRSGPYLVRGPVTLIDEDGTEITVRRAIVPLCRCGRSRTKPLCDGSHGVAVRPVEDADRDAANDAVSRSA